MRSSLIFKLLGAFLLVIAMMALIISWLTSQATQNAFELYTTRSGQAWAQNLAPALAEYYAMKGSWEGVEALLQSEISSPEPLGAGKGQGQGRGFGAGRFNGLWTLGQRILLVDENRVVISDTSNELPGKTLTGAEVENGAPVLVDGTTVGVVLVTQGDSSQIANKENSPASQFLASVNQSILLSVAGASLIALVLGAALFFQITAPLRQLKQASTAIAQGDFSQRVAIQSKDEFGELGRTFNQMTENLEQEEQQRQRLMADVAHELRTPIAVIQANLEGMLDEVLPLDMGQVAALHDEVLLLNRLVDDLRLLSLAEAGELKLEKRPLELDGLVRQVSERFGFQAQQNGVSLALALPERLPLVRVDATRMTQVLNNLIGNALRYTPEGGTIILRAEQVRAPEECIRLSVSDTGPGIDPAALPFLFDRFYRADQSRARASGGSGLGLAIVKQLVEAHGGKVEAVSPVWRDAGQPGAGTQMILTLPL